MQSLESPQPIPTIIVFGRTGVGKSSLGNRILEKDVFKVGDGMFSKTSQIQAETSAWPLVSIPKICFIDTPGFADNRPGTKNDKIIDDIMELLETLRGGFNIGLFCWEAASRFNQHDIDEIDLLGYILGMDVFTHLWITVTKTDDLKDEIRAQRQSQIAKDLPGLLKSHGITLENETVFFPDPTNSTTFKDSLLSHLQVLIKCSNYTPVTAAAFNEEKQANSKVAIENLSVAPKIAAKYAEIFRKAGAEGIQSLQKLKKNNQELQEEIKILQQKEKEWEELKKRSEEANLKKQEENKKVMTKQKWVWRAETTLSIEKRENDSFIVQNHKNKIDEIRLAQDLFNLNWSWTIEFTHEKGFLERIPFKLFKYDITHFGFRDEQGNLFALDFQGKAMKNLRNTDHFSKCAQDIAKLKTVKFTCEANLVEGKFEVFYEKNLIAENRELKRGIQIRPFIALSAKDIAYIKDIY